MDVLQMGSMMPLTMILGVADVPLGIWLNSEGPDGVLTNISVDGY
jgi:hypothetical protein